MYYSRLQLFMNQIKMERTQLVIKCQRIYISQSNRASNEIFISF